MVKYKNIIFLKAFMDNNNNNNNIEQQGESVNTSNNPVKDSIEEFRAKVENIFNNKLNPEDVIKNTIKIEFIKVLSEKKYSFFNSYVEEENKLEQKFEKYFPMHEEILFSVINNEIETTKNKTIESIKNEKITQEKRDKILEKSIRNTIKNVIKKYCYIIFIFSEKVVLTDLKKFLEMDLNNIAEIYKATNKNIRDLEEFEDELNLSIMLEFIEDKKYSLEDVLPAWFKSSKGKEKLFTEILESKKKLKELETKKENNNTDEFDNDIEDSENYIESIDLAFGHLSKTERQKIINHFLSKLSEETRQLINWKFFASMYRQIHRELMEELTKNNPENPKSIENEWAKTAKKIENAYKKSFQKLFYMFETWFESWFEKDDNLETIKLISKKLLNLVILLKQKDIAFKDFSWTKIDEDFIEELVRNFWKNIENKAQLSVFEGLLKYIFKVWAEGADKEAFFDNLESYQRTIESSKYIEKSGNFIENPDVKNIDFKDWEKVPEEIKYKHVFSEVLADGNWKIKFADFLMLNKTESDEFKKLFEIFKEYYAIDGKWRELEWEEKKEKKEIMENQKNIVKDLEWKTVEDLINNDVNNLNFLIIWWRFILKTRTLKNKEVNFDKLTDKELLQEYKNIKEIEYWVIEKISSALFDGDWLSKNIIFNPSWRVKNTSARTIGLQCSALIKWLEKWFINLKKESIKTTNKDGKEEIKIISSLTNLYIPKWISSKKLPNSEARKEIENYIDSWISLCNEILKKENIQKYKEDNNSAENWEEFEIKKKYLALLEEEYEILPKNQTNYDIEKLVEIQKLVKVLEFIRGRIETLDKMLEIWNNDRKELINSKEISSLIGILSKNSDKKSEEIEKVFKKPTNYSWDSNKLLNLFNKTKDSIKKLLTNNEKIFTNNEKIFWPEKTFDRAFKKLIADYSWNYNELWDLTRLRIISNGIDDLINNIVAFIKFSEKYDKITNISIVDKIWEPLSLPKERSGYRDTKLLLKLKSGNTVEVQFQIKEMYEVKDKWINLMPTETFFEKLNKDATMGNFKKVGNTKITLNNLKIKEEEKTKNAIIEKMKSEQMTFTKDEVSSLWEYAGERHIKLPKKEILISLMWEDDSWIEWREYEKILTLEEIKTDHTYWIIRNLPNELNSVSKKLTRLERVMADVAWSKIVLGYLKSKNVKLN